MRNARKYQKKESGQAVVEYLFLIVFVVLTASVIINNLRTEDPPIGIGLCPLWGVMVRSVVAGCGNCEAGRLGNQPVCLQGTGN